MDSRQSELLLSTIHKGPDEAILIAIDQYIKTGRSIHVRNEIGATFLHKAAYYNRCETVKRLVQLGINVNCIDKYKRTPLHDAIRGSWGYAIGTLLNLGADPKMGTLYSSNALEYAKSFKSSLPIEILEECLTKPVEKERK